MQGRRTFFLANRVFLPNIYLLHSVATETKKFLFSQSIRLDTFTKQNFDLLKAPKAL